MKTKTICVIVAVFSIGPFLTKRGHGAASTSSPISGSSPEFILPSDISDPDRVASGTIKPNGLPKGPPSRVEAGESCIVDLTQAYTVTGTLSGSFEVNYRILVHGPCTEPPGTFDEEWIAFGTFSGSVNNTQTEAKFTYIAKVRESGKVDGTMVFGQGITGELNVKGNFKDGILTYYGAID